MELQRTLRYGQSKQALISYGQMHVSDVKASAYTYVAVLKACADIAALDQGKMIHSDIIKRGLQSDSFVGGTLVDMYAKCFDLEDSCKVFEKLPVRNIGLWNAMIAGYAQHGHDWEALQMFEKMLQEGTKPTKITFVYSLKACANRASLDHTKIIHAEIRKRSFELDMYLGSTLVDAYAKCGSLEDAHTVFDKLVVRDTVSWNALIAGYASHGQGQEALEVFKQMQQEGTQPDKVTYVCMLKACTSITAVHQAKLIHTDIKRRGFETDLFVGSTLVDMYAKWGSLEDACKIFDKMPARDMVTWNAMIGGYAESGYGYEALKLLKAMEQEGKEPNKVTLICLAKACASILALDEGRLINTSIIKRGLELDLHVGSTLVEMYVECGSLKDARSLFDMLESHDVVSWSSMIAGCADHGLGWEALQLFEKMCQEGIEPDEVLLVFILKACCGIRALSEGKMIHLDVIKRGFELNLFVGSSLIDMYSKCQSVEDACRVFERLLVQDVVSWSAMISGYSEYGHGQEALELFERMRGEGIEPNEVVFVCVLRACSSIESKIQGQLIHSEIVKHGFESDPTVGSALVDMYAKSGSLEEACQVFDKFPIQSVELWNVMIRGYVEHGHGLEALQLFEDMQQAGTEPDEITFLGTLKACSIILDLGKGKLIHVAMVKARLESDTFVGSTLVDVYAKCGSLDDACVVFDKLPQWNVVSWNTMIGGYTEHEHLEEAFLLLEEMQREGTEPDQTTFACILKACSSLAALDQGKLIHADILVRGLESDHFLGSTLVDMYSKCSSLMDGRNVFDRLQVHNVVSWNAMISGYVEHGYGEYAIDLLAKMQHDEVLSDEITFVCALKACSGLAALYDGRKVHAEILMYGLEPDVYVGSTLVDMYARCGSLEDASKVFDSLLLKNAITWNAMIAGLGEHGLCDIAQHYFVQMQEEGIMPDSVTFVCLLSACSHSGLVREAGNYFESMREDYGLTQKTEHYICLVDLLGRAGRLDEAENLVLKMPCHANSVVWMALLGSCAKHGNLELGRRAFDELVECDCGNIAGYVLMSNMYASNYMWAEVQKIQEMRSHIK